MAETSPELRAKLEELEHELEVVYSFPSTAPPQDPTVHLQC